MQKPALTTTLACLVCLPGLGQENPETAAPGELPAPQIRVDGTLLNDLLPPRKPQLGIVVEDLTDQLSRHLGVSGGVYIVSVDQDGPAEKAGLRSGEIILAVNDLEIQSIAELMSAVAKADGETLQITLQGEDGQRTTDVQPILVDLPQTTDPTSGDYGDSEPPTSTGKLIDQIIGRVVDQLDDSGAEDWHQLLGDLIRTPVKPAGISLPDNLEIRIQKREGLPARVSVQLDSEEYETDVDHLNDLPQPIGNLIRDLVTGPRGTGIRFGDFQIEIDRLGSQKKLELPPAIDQDPPSLKKPYQDDSTASQIDQLQKQLNELQRKINQIQHERHDFD